MQIDRKSFFMVTFLGVHPYHSRYPRTICELGRAVLWRSIVWLFYATAAAVYLTALVSGTYLLIKAGLSDTFAISQLFPKEGAGLAGLAVIATLVTFTILSIVAIIAGGTFVTEKAVESKFVGNLIDTIHTPRQKGKVSQFISGLYKRFKDKTCVIIEYTNIS